VIQINTAIKLAMRNKTSLSFVEKAGCYYCMKIIEVKDIVEYTDQGETALCPNCKIDAIIPDGNLTIEHLKEINNYWFT
jgi:hypothetical protein